MKKLIASLAFISAVLFAPSLAMADEKPSFPGGEAALKKYLNENVHYPESAKEMGVEGIVVVGFIVETDGSLKNIKILKFIDPDLEKEAIRVVTAMPAWIPAEQNNTPVSAPSEVDVPFLLD